jgi:hypothetical protein
MTADVASSRYVQICAETIYEGMGFTRADLILGAHPDVTEKQIVEALIPLLQADEILLSSLGDKISDNRLDNLCRDYNGIAARAVEKAKQTAGKRKQDQESYITSHSSDRLTVDYAVYQEGIGGKSKITKSPAGANRAPTLGQYLKWEDTMRARMQDYIQKGIFGSKVQVGNEILEATTYRSRQCAESIKQQWVASFGYPHSVLRGSILRDGYVDLARATGIICKDV